MLTVIGIILFIIASSLIVINKVLDSKLIAEQKRYIALLEAKIAGYVRNGIHD